MAVKTQCPRCKQPLSVPNKLAGSYANCPRCQGRFWISKDAPLDSSVSDSVAMPSGSITLTQVPSGKAVPLARSAPAPLQAATDSSASLPPQPFFPSVTPPPPIPSPSSAAAGPPAAPPQARKVARLVSADTAQSSLKIAADGQLPNLQLQDLDKKQKGQGKSRSASPLVLVGVWVLSIVATVAIFVLPGANSGGSANTPEKADALRQIEDPQFFGDPSRGKLLPYQRLLREARQARAREDYKAERKYYQKVLDLLRTESPDGSQSSDNRLGKGITGSRTNDRKLETLIITVLGD